jgi:hypothetical protein
MLFDWNINLLGVNDGRADTIGESVGRVGARGHCRWIFLNNLFFTEGFVFVLL